MQRYLDQSATKEPTRQIHNPDSKLDESLGKILMSNLRISNVTNLTNGIDNATLKDEFPQDVPSFILENNKPAVRKLHNVHGQQRKETKVLENSVKEIQAGESQDYGELWDANMTRTDSIPNKKLGIEDTTASRQQLDNAIMTRADSIQNKKLGIEDTTASRQQLDNEQENNQTGVQQIPAKDQGDVLIVLEDNQDNSTDYSKQQSKETTTSNLQNSSVNKLRTPFRRNIQQEETDSQLKNKTVTINPMNKRLQRNGENAKGTGHKTINAKILFDPCFW